MMKTILWVAFGLMCAAQIFVPAQMILSREAVLKKGQPFKFKMQPYDPVDPFRGNYLQLAYEANTVQVDSGEWDMGGEAYAILTTDSAGFAKVESLSKTPPSPGVYYFKTNVSYATAGEAFLMHPFDRYYIESKLAPEAEEAVRNALIDSSATAYAIVYVKGDRAVLKSLNINGKRLEEIVGHQKYK